MNPQLVDYIQTKRQAGLTDDQIRTNLTGAGWQPTMVDSALGGGTSDVPPPPPTTAPVPLAGQVAQQPTPVVQSFSTHGLEYMIMFISLWVWATSLGALLHNSIDTIFNSQNVGDSSGAVSFAAIALIVTLPIFSILFLRLKKAEKIDPNLRRDPSRKRAVQLTLLVTFLIGLFKIITYLYALMNGGQGALDFIGNGAVKVDPVADLLHTLVTLVIAGTIFAYYWHDDHRKI